VHMACLYVTETHLVTVARRISLSTGVVVLALSGAGFALAGPAAAGAGAVGFSPATDVVAKAPMAVSVTFAVPLRAQGAQLRVIGANGDDLGRGRLTTDHKTLRRQLRLGAPGGNYAIRWSAVSASGHRMSGAFSFTAARGNGPASSKPSSVGGEPTPAVQQFPPGAAAASEGPAVQPDATLGEAAPVAVRPAHQIKDHGKPGGLPVIPLAVGALLVLAAGLVARLNRRRAQLP
jgi:copper resistance protein C